MGNGNTSNIALPTPPAAEKAEYIGPVRNLPSAQQHGRSRENQIGAPNYCHCDFVDRTQAYCETFVSEAQEVIRARICKNCMRWDVERKKPVKHQSE